MENMKFKKAEQQKDTEKAIYFATWLLGKHT